MDNHITRPKFIELPRKSVDITGQKYGRLTALGPIGQDRHKAIIWLCVCECGNVASIVSRSLRCGHTQSCGCLHDEVRAATTRKHGLHLDRAYVAYHGIIQRCENPKNNGYIWYGARGIKMCDEWRHDFQLFYDHVSALPNFGLKNYSLDRIDNSGNYCPGNVRWATPTEQHRNTRFNRLLTHNGKTQCLAAWAEEFGLTHKNLTYRLDKGWDFERALTTPVKTRDDLSRK